MQKAIIGKKLGMTQLFTQDGTVIPVTVIEAGPVAVVQKKTVENDGYNAIQVGFEDCKDSSLNKPLKGHLAKAGVAGKKHLKEFRKRVRTFCADCINPPLSLCRRLLSSRRESTSNIKMNCSAWFLPMNEGSLKPS